MGSQKEKFKVYKGVFDQFTLQTLEKLRRQGHYDEIIGPLKIGKESNVSSKVICSNPVPSIFIRKRSKFLPFGSLIFDAKIILLPDGWKNGAKFAAPLFVT